MGICATVLVPVGLHGAGNSVLSTEEPYLSVRTGLRCSQCHTNRSGGGGRNDFGSLYAQTQLGTFKTPFIDRSLNSFFSVGGNFRVVASGSVGDRPVASPRTSVDIIEQSLQIEARVVPDVLALYVDQLVGPGSARTREAFALVESLPLEGYLKAGKFLLPFGLRLADNSEFIRERTGFNYNTPDLGFEVGIEPGPLSLFVALTNGTQGAGENNSEKQVTASAAVIFPSFRLGGSASRNDGPDGRRDAVGAFGGFRAGRFAFLGELDYIFDTLDSDSSLDQFVAYVEGNFLPVRGLNLKATYGFLDPDRNVGENARTRFRFGLEWFAIAFAQVSTFYTLLEDIPQSTTDADALSLELHVFF